MHVAVPRAAVLLGGAALHHHVLHHHFHGPAVGYAAIALAAFGSWAGIPGPGEPVLIAAALYAAHGRLDLADVLLAAWAGATVGGIAGWLVGVRGGRPLLMARGPFRRQRIRAIERGQRFFSRFGLLAVYLAPSWVAGVTQMRAARFIPADAVAALIWTLLVGLGAYFAGPPLADAVSEFGVFGLVAVGLAAVALGLVRWLRRPGRRPPLPPAS
jgi:membrane protein DedA with SNARE-associated domain